MRREAQKGDHVSGLHLYEPKRFKAIVKPELLPLELALYISYILGCFILGGLSLYNDSTVLQFDDRFNSTLRAGDWLKGRQKDQADFEWDVWVSTYKQIVTVGCIHSLTSLLVAHFAYTYRRHAWLSVGVACFVYVFGIKGFLLVLSQVGTLFLAALTGNVIFTWGIALCWLALHNQTTWLISFIDYGERPEISYGLLFFSTTFLLLRLASFAIEKARHVNGSGQLGPDITFSIFDAFVYAFYIPFYYSGPVFVYKYFQCEVMKPRSSWTLWEIVHIGQKALRVILGMIYCEVFLNLIYIHTIARNHDLLRELPVLSLGTMVLYLGSFYQANYCVVYGTAGCFMMVDRIVPLSNPRCVVRTAYFSDCWRFFDPGLHGFFRNYVYIPLGGSRHGRPRQLVATFVTFAFVSLWHGGQLHLIAWAACNCVAVFIEQLGAEIAAIPRLASIEAKLLGPMMTRRLHAFVNVPLYMFSIAAILIFFTNFRSGFVYIDRIMINGSVFEFFVVYAMLYSMTMFSDEVERWEWHRGRPSQSEQGAT